MTRLKFFSAARNPEAAHRRTIDPPPKESGVLRTCQFVTRRVRIRTPEFGLSMMLVVAKLLLRLGGRPSRLMVKISDKPSRKVRKLSDWVLPIKPTRQRLQALHSRGHPALPYALQKSLR